MRSYSRLTGESLEDSAVLILLHPHGHGDFTLTIHCLHHLVVLYLCYELRLDAVLHLCTLLIIDIRIGIEMTTSEGKLLCWFHIKWLTRNGIHHLHLLSEIVIEVIVGLVATFLLSAAEHVNIIATLIAGLHDGCGTLLQCLSLWLDETDGSIAYLFFCSEFLAGRLLLAYLWVEATTLKACCDIITG